MARDVRRLRILHGAILDSHTSLEEYQQVYRTYMNARRQHRMGRRGTRTAEEESRETGSQTHDIEDTNTAKGCGDISW